MRVLQVSKFYPPVMGGIESVAWELTEGLIRAGVPADVLCSDQQPWGRRELSAAGYEIWRAGSLGVALSTSIAPAMILHLARLACRADIIHLHMPDPMAAAATWCVRPKARMVVHWHSDVVRQRRALWAYEPLQAWLLDRADAIIATSPPYATSSQPLQPWLAKVEVVPIGISDNCATSCSHIASALRKRFRGRRLVFALGRMTYYKGFDVLIDAATTLPEDCAVLIGGDGELLEHFRAMVAKRGLAGRVHLEGKILDHELASYFEACDVFCMPSTVRAEAYGVAMLEAMVMGKPIVASDIVGSGVPWVNLDGITGYNVPVGDAVALGAALRRVLTDRRHADRLGAAARERFLAEFHVDLMTRRMIDVYERLL